MWINSRRRVWSCERVNTPPACTCLGLIWKHKSRPAWHGQRGFCECPNCRLESEISAWVIQSYCLIIQKCSPPSSHFLSISACGIWSVFLYMKAFLLVSLQVLLVRHAAILLLWWGIHWPLICLAQLCSFSNPQSAGMTRAKSLASSSMYFFHFISLHSLDIKIC